MENERAAQRTPGKQTLAGDRPETFASQFPTPGKRTLVPPLDSASPSEAGASAPDKTDLASSRIKMRKYP
jgi:hypothetical protein